MALSLLRASIALLLVLLCSQTQAGSVLIDDFRTLDNWRVHADGGFIEISADAANTRGANPSMRLLFTRANHEYGNAQRTVTLPPNATGVTFDLFVRQTSPGAGLSVWLFEADGDAWHAWVKVDGKAFPDMSKGWHSCVVPITSFAYQPRGNGKRELLTANKMLIGINAAAGDVSIASLAYRTAEKRSHPASSKPKPPRIENGSRGRIAILRDSFPHLPGDSDPAALAPALRKHGYGVTVLNAAQLADPTIVTAKSFDCLILPYGARYPQDAGSAITDYLKSGGSLFTTGGYAFDEPTLASAAPALTAEDVASGKGIFRRINARFGDPENARLQSGTTVFLRDDQIAIFDPCYHLKNAAQIASSPRQHIVAGIQPTAARLEGYAACSMLGSCDPVFPVKWGRHISIVDALDSSGRYLGSAGAIAHIYRGPYAGSSWAFFGVKNTDLFSRDSRLLARLPAIIDAIVTKTYLHSLETDFACYKDGETVRLTCIAANYGRKATRPSVRFRIYDRAGKQVWQSPAHAVALAPGETKPIKAQFRLDRYASDLYRVTAEMSISGRKADVMETGFATYKPAVIASGLKLDLKNNYLHDADRPLLLSGTNVTGAMLYSGNENPLVWDRDLQRMRESGINIMRLLHFSPFLSDKPAFGAIKPIDLGVDRMPPTTERKLDALVQLCQKHKIAMFLTLHDWMHAELSNEELAAQRKWAKLIASRYRDVPGFMLDVENEPMIPLPFEANPKERMHVVSAWNEFLRAKYGTDEALKKSWTVSPPEAPIGQIAFRAGTPAWDDMRTYDADLFRATLANKWIEANNAGVKEGDPDTLLTVGFLQEYYAVNKIACMKHQDLANTHSYNTPDVLRCDLKLLDRRFEGKSFSLGEFGSFQDYHTRMGGHDSSNQNYTHYLLAGHYLFGLGGSFLANWCWKDMDDVLFAWGVNHSNGGPAKSTLLAYRNMSLLMRQVRPVYESPEVFLVLPTGQMTGEQRAKMVPQLYQWAGSLLSARAQFGTTDDLHLSLLPPSAKLLVYPFPYTIPDEAYDQLKSFVERGGTLCITGDVSYDQFRKRTLTERLTDLCGVKFISENYPNIGFTPKDEACINVEPAGAAVTGSLYTHAIGKGKVIFTPHPMGTTGIEGKSVYTDTLAALGPAATVDAPGVEAFRLAETDGCRTIILANLSQQAKTVPIAEPQCEPVQISLKANGVGMVRFNTHGQVISVESQGPVTIGATRIPITGHFAITAADGKSLMASRKLIILPFGNGEIDLSPLPAFGSRSMIVQRGEIRSGKWTPLSEPSGPKVQVTGETAFDIHIAAPKPNLADVGRHVASEMMLWTK